MFTLQGLKVIEMGRWISAPYCATLLSDLGADVTKVESPEGDPTRAFSSGTGDVSHYFSHYNSNKKSVFVDLKTEKGKAEFTDLVSDADIFVHNLRPGVMDRLGFGYEVVKSINPLLVYMSISGFGSGNKFSERPAFNAVIEAESGLMDVNGGPLEGPMASGNFATDHATGLHAALAALSAIIGRHQTGCGRHIDISMFDVALSTIGPRLTAALNGEKVATSLGNRDSTSAPGNVFRSKEGRIIYIDAGTDTHFRGLQRAMGEYDLLEDAKFGSGLLRSQNVDDLERRIASWAGTLSAQEISSRLEENVVPHGVVARLDEVVEHPLVKQRNMKIPSRITRADSYVPGLVPKMSP